jgi:hypothetical protein
MNCPFCYEELDFYDTARTPLGFKVEFTCENESCEKGEEKIFFTYVDSSNLEY